MQVKRKKRSFIVGKNKKIKITEKAIMRAINDFTGKKTLIMIAHRLTTVQKCDKIFMMNNGSIVDSGTYQQLLKKNEQFKKM